MRKPFLTTGTLFFGLIIGLAALGVGYGLWSDELEINGTVTTGKLDARMTLGEVDQGQYVNNGHNDDLEAEDKDVGECTAQLIAGPQLSTANDTFDTGPDKVEISVTNGYPSFHCYVEVDVKNAGTIPIKVHAPGVFLVTPPANANAADIHVELHNCWTNDLQLEPGEDTVTQYPDCVVHIHVEQSADENATYSFLATIFAHQYNEEPQ
jgi:hypothetical protein